MATKKRKSRPKKQRVSETIYFKSLNSLIDHLFQVASEKHLTWTQMAGNAGLGYATVRKLGERKTRYPQYRTVELLARSLGGRVAYQKGIDHRKIETTWTPRLFKARRTAA